jgi:hypothetical protein
MHAHRSVGFAVSVRVGSPTGEDICECVNDGQYGNSGGGAPVDMC